MNKHNVKKEPDEFSPEELDLARILESRLPLFTLKSLAKTLCTTEEQVREHLKNLNLLQVVSNERIAERRRVRVLARLFYADLARATQEFYEKKLSG